MIPKFKQSWPNKLKWSLPWLARYPFWRLSEQLRRWSDDTGVRHLIFVIANHYEPGWCGRGSEADTLANQIRKVENWRRTAKRAGDAVRDHDGKAFRHTNYYPGEQYHRELLELLAELQAEGYGEVEIHWHHGLHEPDTAANFRARLTEFRDILAERHRCLSRWPGDSQPKYSFVHGNFALANSRGGFACGIDNEMRILQETGCVSDLTLPSFPWPSQVAQINDIYECGHSLDQAIPHRSGPSLRVGRQPALPILLSGPLLLDWNRRLYGLPVPRVEDGVLTANCTFNHKRLDMWRNANITVKGRPEWVFIKLYCHGFFPDDEEATVGSVACRFWTEVLELAERNHLFKVHFASAREAFNLVMAAVDGCSGAPGQYRNYRLRQLFEPAAQTAGLENASTPMAAQLPR